MCCFLGGRTGIVEDEGEALFLGGAAVELPKEATDTASSIVGDVMRLAKQESGASNGLVTEALLAMALRLATCRLYA